MMDDSNAGDEREAKVPTDWINKMREHYDATGLVRHEDIRFLLGDQTKAVRMRFDPEGEHSTSNTPLFD